jgi:hypothetical protein
MEPQQNFLDYQLEAKPNIRSRFGFGLGFDLRPKCVQPENVVSFNQVQE